ncbi:hypothetical protein FRC06_004537 [Ceratobasidium sp. 370]|nr:hypothetical protein FRC06_004537 [Ceratobasidium sp. 370]
MPQIVDYRPGVKLEAANLYDNSKDESESELVGNNKDNQIEGEGKDEGEDEDEEIVEPELEAPERSEIYYPQPVRSIAKQLTALGVPRHVLMASYQVADLIQVL